MKQPVHPNKPPVSVIGLIGLGLGIPIGLAIGHVFIGICIGLPLAFLGGIIIRELQAGT